MAQAWIIGNWKQNPSSQQEVRKLVGELLDLCQSEMRNIQNNCHLMVAPSYVYVAEVANTLQKTKIDIAVQDISKHVSTVGAYTGDCSAQQCASVGANWVIIGHSERRNYYNEDNVVLKQKMLNALEQELGIILCIGETNEDYINGKTLTTLKTQLSVLSMLIDNYPNLTEQLAKSLVIAYEPVWAIGTGKVPSVQKVTEIHQHIKQYLEKINHLFREISVLYGGSVTPENAHEFAGSLAVDGVLIGGASLQADKFFTIAQKFYEAKSA